MNSSNITPIVDPAFRTLADVVMAMPDKPTDADILVAFNRCIGIGYRQGIEAVSGLEEMLGGVQS